VADISHKSVSDDGQQAPPITDHFLLQLNGLARLLAAIWEFLWFWQVACSRAPWLNPVPSPFGLARRLATTGWRWSLRGIKDTMSTLDSKYEAVRSMTRSLVAPLSAEDQMVQSCAEASPVKWHQAHTTWFFETFVLRPFLPDYKPFREEFHRLFNSYYLITR
jgi:hypothetical protein